VSLIVATDWGAIRGAILQAVELVGVPVIWSEQETERPALPYATVKVRSAGDTILGLTQHEVLDATEHYTAMRILRVDVNFFASKPDPTQAEPLGQVQAPDLAARLSMILRTAQASKILNASAIGVRRIRPVQDLSEVVGERWESRAMLEFEANYVEQVDVDGDDAAGVTSEALAPDEDSDTLDIITGGP